MRSRDEVRLVGLTALALAALLVILALLVAPGAGNQATPSPVPPPVPRMVRTERFIDYPTPTEQERATGIEMLRVAFAAQDGAIGSLPAWWVAQTRYLPPLPPERPSEAPTAAAGPSPTLLPPFSHISPTQTETGRPERAACLRVGRRTVWEGRYRWRCRR